MKIICKRVYERAGDGAPVSYRTRYYRYYDGKHASVGGRKDATRMDAPLAAQVCAQLLTIAGPGWEVIDQDAEIKRERKPAKAAA